MSDQNIAVLPQLYLFQISHLNKKETRKIKLFIVLLSDLNDQLIDERFL